MTDGDRRAEAIASLASRSGLRIGVAESLTCGKLAAELGAAPDASEWFRGGVVAYAAEVKFDVLGVTPGPVVTSTCAREMAAGVASLLGADATVAVTGVGGPDPEEGEQPGTVHIAAWVRDSITCERLELPGDPEDVLARTTSYALDMLLSAMQEAAVGESMSPSGVPAQHD